MGIKRLLLACAICAVLAGCATSDTLEDYRANNVPCPKNLHVPCKIGPDGLLYRY